MRRIFLLSLFALLSLSVLSQQGNRKEYPSKGSTTYLGVSALQSIGWSRSFEKANSYLEMGKYHFISNIDMGNGVQRLVYCKNVYSENGGDLKPINGEMICSRVVIYGKNGDNFSITSEFFNPPETLIDELKNDAINLGFKLGKSTERRLFFKGESDMSLTIKKGLDRIVVVMLNYDIEKAEKEKKEKENVINKTKGLIINPSGYLNGANPALTTISINDLIKLYNGKTFQFAKQFLPSKGYKYIKYDMDHIWQKGTDKVSTFSTLIGEYSNGGLFEFDLELYNDKTCAALVVQLEKLGYKIKYKNPWVDYQYFFVKEGSSFVFAVTGKNVVSVKKQTTYIEYKVSIMSQRAFNSMKANGNVKPL